MLVIFSLSYLVLATAALDIILKHILTALRIDIMLLKKQLNWLPIMLGKEL
jgi:hypothetical protein